MSSRSEDKDMQPEIDCRKDTQKTKQIWGEEKERFLNPVSLVFRVDNPDPIINIRRP